MLICLNHHFSAPQGLRLSLNKMIGRKGICLLQKLKNERKKRKAETEVEAASEEGVS